MAPFPAITVSVRDRLRPLLGPAWRRLHREVQWRDPRVDFRLKPSGEPLPHIEARHATPLFRPLLGLDPVLQSNKAINLRIAAARLDGLVLRPGQRLSFWREVGRPSYARGFADGLVLDHGALSSGVGGGLCQLTNLLYWMTLHTRLDVVERWRHSYDVFPDAGRSQPFGSGATCAWPALDLQVENRTSAPYRLSVLVDDAELSGEWACTEPFSGRFEVYERAHLITHEGPGVNVRHNQLWRREFAGDGRIVRDTPLTENHALLMYEPFLGPGACEGAGSATGV